MSRSGYYDYDGCGTEWSYIRYRGAVLSAIRGKRGQAMLKDLAAALDAMPNKRLIADELEHGGEVCALGALGQVRGLDMSKVDPYDPPQVAPLFGIAEAMAREIVYVNDEDTIGCETPEQRWKRVRDWVEESISK